MPPKPATPTDVFRLPISNLQAKGDYTAIFEIGAHDRPVHLLLDTGSSSLAINVHDVVSKDLEQTTYLEHLSYGSNPAGFTGPVVNTSLTMTEGDNTPEAGLATVNVTLIPPAAGQPFGTADGIMGLAYAPLNTFTDIGIKSAAWAYKAIGTPTKKETVNLPSYFTHLETTGVVANKFAFYTHRSRIHYGTDTPDTDPLNHGEVVFGAGAEETDLYEGDFQAAQIVHDAYYNTHMIAVYVGDQRIEVPDSFAGTPSNSIIDTGTNGIAVPAAVYTQMLAAFAEISPKFRAAISDTNLVRTAADLDGWPDVTVELHGTDAPVRLTIPPQNYWQLNAHEDGSASFTIFSFSAPFILGLPLLNGYYTVFDRSAADGLGVVKFASIKRPTQATI
ncbi:pepsin-like aspartyl protease [Pseudosulfitobacter sp. SM2401]|uniref:pepsin-like aspartic protease n=1 Tax=Pseudosulfitobacter sp. SM2401 TaxID=3350098 RepID=UPI0036F43EE2